MSRTVFSEPFSPEVYREENRAPYEPAWPDGSRPGSGMEKDPSPISPEAQLIIEARERVIEAIDCSPPAYN